MNKNPEPSTAMTRRDAIKKTILFSTGLLAAHRLPSLTAAQAPAADFSGPGLHLLAVGDYGSKNESQARVARQMARFAQTLSQPLDGVLALGDNFYGKMTPERFDRDFEKMYDEKSLPCPFYACIGNHDYETAAYGRTPEPRKFEMQLEYARENPSSRWKMPAKWYAREFSNAGSPLLKVIFLDSNIREGSLTPQEKLAQKRFLEAEMARETKAPWLWIVLHHPFFTETTKRKDSSSLIRLLGDYVKDPRVSICLSGHDHNLQHLRVDGYGANFIISGAGGAKSYEVTPSSRGFAQVDLGFNHFHVNASRIKAQFINADGQCLHAFQRRIDGQVEILS